MAEAQRGDCQRGAELSALLDGEIGRVERGWLRAHVRRCHACACELAGLARVRSQLRSLPPREVPEGLWRQAAVRAGGVGSRIRRRRAERRAIATLLVAAAITGALAWGVGDEQERTATRPLKALVGGQSEDDGFSVRPLIFDPAD